MREDLTVELSDAFAAFIGSLPLLKLCLRAVQARRQEDKRRSLEEPKSWLLRAHLDFHGGRSMSRRLQLCAKFF